MIAGKIKPSMILKGKMRTEFQAAFVLGRIAGLALPVLLAGCAVPQPAGYGMESVMKEPRTGAEYYQYLPEAYVKNNGIHPQNPNRRWPLVITFHGMKPYDSWDRQIHEWQEQADAYGFVVVAPWLQTCDSFMEFPLTKEHNYVLRDKEAVMAILDHVLATTRCDPNAVLSTSWSSGGFMAHYFPNRFPHRFSCVATRLSNFSREIMIEQTVPLYRDMPVAVFIGESDFPACITQSQEAVAWYKSRGFGNVEGKMIDSMNHRRIPQTAAAFFARQLGIEPLNAEVAARTLAEIRMHDWQAPPELVTAMVPRSILPTQTLLAAQTQPPAPQGAPNPAPISNLPKKTHPAVASNPPTAVVAQGPVIRPGPQQSGLQWTPLAGTSGNKPAARPTHPATPQRSAHQPLPIYASNSGAPVAASPAPVQAVDVSAANGENRNGTSDGAFKRYNLARPSGNTTTPMRSRPTPPPAPKVVSATPDSAKSSGSATARGGRTSQPVHIRVTAPPDGTRPLYVAFSTDLAPEKIRDATFLWTHNGTPVCDTSRGARILDTAGAHTLSVLIMTRDGQEFRGSTTIHVRDAALSSGRTRGPRQIAS